MGRVDVDVEDSYELSEVTDEVNLLSIVFRHSPERPRDQSFPSSIRPRRANGFDLR